jgi:hypothetical protein
MTPAPLAACTAMCAIGIALLALPARAQARVEPVLPPPMEPAVQAAPAPPQPAGQPQPAAIQPSGSATAPRIQPSGSPQTDPLRLPEPEDAAAQAQLQKLRASALASARRGSSAEKAAARSAWLLGLLYLHGERVPLDRLQAQRWFERAQALGEPRASAGLAWCQIDGCQGPPNPAAARPWIAQLRSVDAGLALLLEWWVEERLAPLHVPRPHGGPQAGADAHAQLLQRAAQAGNADAINEQGLAHLTAARLPEAMAQFRAGGDRAPPAATNARRPTARPPPPPTRGCWPAGCSSRACPPPPRRRPPTSGSRRRAATTGATACPPTTPRPSASTRSRRPAAAGRPSACWS